MAEKRVDSVVVSWQSNSAVEGAGLFYAVRFEPIPSKTCFDVSLKTYSSRHATWFRVETSCHVFRFCLVFVRRFRRIEDPENRDHQRNLLKNRIELFFLNRMKI
ncbi:Protein CBG15357 [Caenorhabditis briggsae]|uniref:Protein CBG15357 n=1 Tax=Caenorhabditis briggsae TaxID=6238 RepID=A8XM11_CAEBR|nr:Protein CBG15357 [Caenorhabditis briggsae]CAP33686.1 Protein CBG15357 [Caenorhabditis briggsae]